MQTRRSPFVLGLIAFVATFALIVTLTLAGVGGRHMLGAFRNEPTPAATNQVRPAPEPGDPSPSIVDTGATQAAPSPSVNPNIKGDFCHRPKNTQQRPSQGKASLGTITGGGIAVKVEEPFDATQPFYPTHLSFSTDAVGVIAPVAENWVSNFAVGQVMWQPGVKYPGNSKAAERIFDCLVSNSLLWEPKVSGRTLENKKVEPVTLDGMAGHKVTGRLTFTATSLEGITHSDITVAVVEGPKGPAVYASLIANKDGHASAAQKSFESITKFE